MHSAAVPIVQPLTEMVAVAPPPHTYLYVQLQSDNAKLPVRGSEQAAGLDVFACENQKIQAGQQALVDTGISVCPSEGTYVRVAPRSGLCVKNSVTVGAGVMDRDYTGRVKVLLLNYGNTEFVVTEGDRIAQLIVEKIEMPDPIRVGRLPKTGRSAHGFGSTGMRENRSVQASLPKKGGR